MKRWRELTPKQCLSCTVLADCRGGCRALGELLGSEGDPLMGEFIQQDQKAVDIDLYENSYPLLECVIKREAFGYALIRGHNIVPVTHEAKSILDELNGNKTLQQIQNDFGQDALNFVGSLYLQGMVELA